MAVRGARNYPCMGHPGKRAPTVEICNSDKPFMPLAMRQHTLGPYPLDPNLIAQGVPPDDRITTKTDLRPGWGNAAAAGSGAAWNTGGAAGRNPPPDTVGAAVPPVPSSGPRLAPISPMSADVPAFAPLDVPAPGELPAAPPPPAAPAPQDQVDGGQPHAAPSSFGGNASKPAPSIVVAKYDPRTGRYVCPDGKSTTVGSRDLSGA